MPTDTAEREQKPSLAWIMPSREEEKPTLCRINQHSLWLGCGMTPLRGVLLNHHTKESYLLHVS